MLKCSTPGARSRLRLLTDAKTITTGAASVWTPDRQQRLVGVLEAAPSWRLDAEM